MKMVEPSYLNRIGFEPARALAGLAVRSRDLGFTWPRRRSGWLPFDVIPLSFCHREGGQGGKEEVKTSGSCCQSSENAPRGRSAAHATRSLTCLSLPFHYYTYTHRHFTPRTTSNEVLERLSRRERAITSEA